MLHEIFKGMDNASEAIDENFKKLGYEVIENEKGRCVKYADGTMKCERIVSLNQTTSLATGNLYRTPTPVSYDFPIPFVKEPYVSASSIIPMIAWPVVGSELSQWGALRFYSSVNNQTIEKVILIAEGHWK